jgi:hypothetical protein
MPRLVEPLIRSSITITNQRSGQIRFNGRRHIRNHAQFSVKGSGQVKSGQRLGPGQLD